MSESPCCPVMDAQWTQRVVDEQWADIYFCASCGHVHRTEKYATPMRFPYAGRCVNCGGDQQETGNYGGQNPAAIRCTLCGKTAIEDQELHVRLASLHPSQDFLAAATALSEAGRHVLALKLATAEIHWGQDPIGGMTHRLSTLEALNEYDRALDEAYEWSDQEGSPPLVWGLIAALEASTGNLKGSMTALERGLNKYPDNYEWWTDYAELQVHSDERPGALRAASKGIHGRNTGTIERCVNVLAEVGERYYANGQFAEALGACSLAGEHQEKFENLAWLRARIAAVNQDQEYLIKWLECTVALNPNHKEALDMLEPYKRAGRRGWFGWGR